MGGRPSGTGIWEFASSSRREASVGNASRSNMLGWVDGSLLISAASPVARQIWSGSSPMIE